MRVELRHQGPRFARINRLCAPFLYRLTLIVLLGVAAFGVKSILTSQDAYSTSVGASRQLLDTKVSQPPVWKIEEFGVFVITAICSLWAYFWLVVALEFSSKDEVTTWEAWFTLAMFPMLVAISWAQDRNWFRGDAKVAPEDKIRRITIGGQEVDPEMAAEAIEAIGRDAATEDPKAAARVAAQEAMRKKKKSRLEYRIQATRKMTGGKSIMPSAKKKDSIVGTELETKADDSDVSQEANPLRKAEKLVVGFAETSIKVMEDCGTAEVKVVRSGELQRSCSVLYSTTDATAKAQTTENMAGRYLPISGQLLKFEANETEKTILITIIDDNEWQPDEHFYVTLQPAEPDSGMEMGLVTHQVIILNDDDPGKFSFSASSKAVLESDRTVSLTIDRCDGVSGQALVYVKLLPLDQLTTKPSFGDEVVLGEGAQPGQHYKQLTSGAAGPESIFSEEDQELEVVFKHEEQEIELTIELLPAALVSNVTFVAEITHIEPEGAKMGTHRTCAIIKSNDKNYKKLMSDIQEMMENELAKYSVETETWSEQFVAAMTIECEDEDDELDWSSYLLHFLAFYWKVMAAFVPPTSYCNGWMTFTFSLVFIGVVTALIGDVAKMFGCVLGLKDSITAITFVALGTSLPDTFASKEATINDETADAAITNVTGSNSVNVFLGLGIPWVLAVCYHSNGKMAYPAGELVFSVLVFFGCALYCLALLIYRRSEWVGGELGGPKKFAWFTSISLALAWVLYIVLSSLRAEEHI